MISDFTKLARRTSLLSACLFGAFVFSAGIAKADITIVSQVNVDGLTTEANGSVPPPIFPITFTTFIQGSKERVECSDGSALIIDNVAGIVYQLDTKAGKYRTEPIKSLEDYSTAFPPRLAKRLTASEDLNFFPAPDTASYLNTSTTKMSYTGGAHYLIIRQTGGDGGRPNAGFPSHHRQDGGRDGSYPGGTGLPGGGAPLRMQTDGNPDDGTMPDQPGGPDTGNSTDGSAPDGGDTGSGGDSGNGGDSGGTGGGAADHGQIFKRSSVPDFYLSGSMWLSPTVKLPKDKHGLSLPIALQMVWAGGPFLSDLTKQLDQDRELPLHSEVTVKEDYPTSAAEANVLLDSTIKTTFDVQSISSTPVSPDLFTVPTAYTKDANPIFIAQVAAPYIEREGPSEDETPGS